MSQKLRTEDVN